MAETSNLKLTNVRLSFPKLWTAKSYKTGDKPKFGANFLIDKEDNEELLKQVKGAIWGAAKEKFGEKAADMFKKNKIAICLHEGADKDYDGYGEQNMYLSASSSKRPLIIDRDRTPLTEEDGRPYAGCYVNAIVRIWIQEDGKWVNAELLGVQFASEGEPFGGGRITEEAFDDLDEAKGTKAKQSKQSKEEATGNGDEEEVPF